MQISRIAGGVTTLTVVPLEGWRDAWECDMTRRTRDGQRSHGIADVGAEKIACDTTTVSGSSQVD